MHSDSAIQLKGQYCNHDTRKVFLVFFFLYFHQFFKIWKRQKRCSNENDLSQCQIRTRKKNLFLMFIHLDSWHSLNAHNKHTAQSPSTAYCCFSSAIPCSFPSVLFHFNFCSCVFFLLSIYFLFLIMYHLSFSFS